MAAVLIVDDDDLMLHMYEVAFANSELAVQLAKNGEEAVRTIISSKPDLVLLDVMMPEMSGIDVLKKIRENPDTTNTKVIILTNLLDQAIKKQSFDLGAKDYLVKSDHTPVEVVQIVKNQLTS